MIRDVHPGSRIRIFPPSRIRIPDPEVKKAQQARDPVSGSATLKKTNENKNDAFKNLTFCLKVTQLGKSDDNYSTLTNNELDILQGEAEIIWSQFLRKNKRMESLLSIE
jgi:hypothetical protein